MVKPKARIIVQKLIPFIFIAFMACGMSLIFYPMMNMQIKGFPVAVASYDQGVQTPKGKVNAGNQMADKLVDSGKKDDAAMKWTKLDSKADVQKSLDNHDYYAVVTLPKDFTATTLAAKQAQAGQAAAGQATAQQGAAAAQAGAAQAKTTQAQPKIDVTVDNSKSPMASMLMNSALTTALGKTGAKVNVTTINTGEKLKSAMGNTGTIIQNAAIVPTYVFSLIGGMFIARTNSKKRYDSLSDKWKTMVKQLVWVAITSLFVGFVVDIIHKVVTGGAWLPGSTFFGTWLSSFAIMTIVNALSNIVVFLGQIAGMVVMFLAMPTAILPVEMLPGFWQKWIYPWAPHHFIGDAFRSSYFAGDGFWNNGIKHMIFYVIGGLVVWALVGLLKDRHPSPQPVEAEVEIAAK